MPQEHVTRAVVRAVERLPGYPAISVLDLSCGEGEVLSILSTAGCEVKGTHFRDDDYIIKDRGRLEGIPVKGGVDLQCSLPFEDAQFDAVLLIEVVEHLESHFNIVSEAGRLLKPGGHLVISTPNIFRLHSRAQFFLAGKHKLIRRRYGWDVDPDDRYAYHIGPVDFPLLHTQLRHAGMGLARLHFTKLKVKSLFFAPLWPLVCLACRLTADRRSAGVSPAFMEGERSLNRWLCHPALLFSEQLLLVARRSDETGPPSLAAPGEGSGCEAADGPGLEGADSWR